MLTVAQVYRYVKFKLHTLNICSLLFFKYTLSIKTKEGNGGVSCHSAQQRVGAPKMLKICILMGTAAYHIGALAL